MSEYSGGLFVKASFNTLNGPFTALALIKAKCAELGKEVAIGCLTKRFVGKLRVEVCMV